MPNIQFLSAENEIQKLYSQLGLVVPVGDLSTGKAPAVQPLSTSSTQTSVTASFNVMTGADLTAMSYTVNDGESQSITPSKGVVTVTLTDLEYNSGPYAIKLTATNETGSTNVTATVALQHYTNWATPDEVLEGNKYIGEDGEEHVGEMEQGIFPAGTLEITENGEGIDVTEYAAVDVAVQSQSANLASVYYREDSTEETDDPELDGVVIYTLETYDSTREDYVVQDVTEEEFNSAIASCDLRLEGYSAEYILMSAFNNGFDGVSNYIQCYTKTYIYVAPEEPEPEPGE